MPSIATARPCPTPFQESGGRIGSKNSVVFMSKIDLQVFKDAIVAGIRSQDLDPQPDHRRRPLRLRGRHVATIETADSLATFNARAKGQGMKAKVHCGLDGVYRFTHWRHNARSR